MVKKVKKQKTYTQPSVSSNITTITPPIVSSLTVPKVEAISFIVKYQFELIIGGVILIIVVIGIIISAIISGSSSISKTIPSLQPLQPIINNKVITTSPTIVPGLTIPFNNGVVMPYTTVYPTTSIVQTFPVLTYQSGNCGFIIAKVLNVIYLGIYEWTGNYTGVSLTRNVYINNSGSITFASSSSGSSVTITETSTTSYASNPTYYKTISIATPNSYTNIPITLGIPVHIYTMNPGDFGLVISNTSSVGLIIDFFQNINSTPSVTSFQTSTTSALTLSILNGSIMAQQSVTGNINYYVKLFGSLKNLSTITLTAGTPASPYTINSGDCGFIVAVSNTSSVISFFEWTGNVTSVSLTTITSATSGTDITINNTSYNIQITSFAGGIIKYCLVML